MIKNAKEIRKDFPFFQKESTNIHYLDNAATSQKPKAMLDALLNSYISENANVHRGVYRLSEEATTTYENARTKTAAFLGGVKSEELFFTSGTTLGINVIARALAESVLKPGDEIILTQMEHHANMVSWQLLAANLGLVIRYAPLTADFRLDIEKLEKMLTPKTKVLAFSHVSNVLGIINPVRTLTKLAKAHGIISVIDGAQGAAHLDLNMHELDCDFYVFSTHKVFGPSGLGVVYGKADLLNRLAPIIGGGEMIERVDFEKSTFKQAPFKFEAGTPGFNQVAAWSATMDYLQSIDRKALLIHERELGRKAFEYLKATPGFRIFSPQGEDQVGIVSLYHEKIHPHDLAFIADSFGVAVRAGNHCAMPLTGIFGVSATLRVSPSIYNLEEDIDAFIAAMEKARKMFDA